MRYLYQMYGTTADLLNLFSSDETIQNNYWFFGELSSHWPKRQPQHGNDWRRHSDRWATTSHSYHHCLTSVTFHTKCCLCHFRSDHFILNAQYNIHEYRNYIDFYLELSILLLIPSWIVLEFTLLRFSITSTSTVFWKLGCFFLGFLSVSDKSLLPMSIQHKVASLHPRENSHTYKTSQCFHKRLNIPFHFMDLWIFKNLSKYKIIATLLTGASALSALLSRKKVCALGHEGIVIGKVHCNGGFSFK